ncbi:hypothetical protein Q5P01_010848 [Channa striata]|uniref:Uncharacterized protein n=1 Tax=Channa striata TaxID=64152 RepID=A0AA88MT88_CHASR|nr:hypothetical protein Q5P01_010848 [Channa striata]
MVQQPVAALGLNAAPASSSGRSFLTRFADSYLPEQLLVNTTEPLTPTRGFLQLLIQAAEETPSYPFDLPLCPNSPFSSGGGGGGGGRWAAAAGAASQPIINSAVSVSCTVPSLSSIQLVEEPNDWHHRGEGIQHWELTPALPLSTLALCSQLLTWQEKCEHGFGKVHFISASSPRQSEGKCTLLG